MTAVEWLIEQTWKPEWHSLKRGDIIEQAKEMEKEQRGYSEEDVREMLFMALYETQQECCTTHTKDSIVRKVLKTFKEQ